MSAPWTDTAWLTEAHAWIAAQLERLGLGATGAIEQPHVRPWSTVLRVPTEAGALWFKAAIPSLAHEAGALELLVRRRADCLPELLAVERERGWMLQADGGTRLRELGEPDRWEEILPLYAGLQADAAADVDALLAAGVPDRRLVVLPTLYAALLEEQRALPAGEVDGLRTLVPRVAALADELAAYGLPETIQHDDLHDANVFVREDGYVFFDWGDASVTHPFFTLHVTLRVLALQLGVEEGSRQLHRFRDAYLEPWTSFAPRADLVRALEPADRLAGLCRALSWQLVAEAVEEEERGEYDDDVADRLRRFRADCS